MTEIQKLWALSVIMMFLSGCGGCNRMIAHWTKYSRVCIDGVLYYQFPSGAAVAYDQQGKVRTC